MSGQVLRNDTIFDHCVSDKVECGHITIMTQMSTRPSYVRHDKIDPYTRRSGILPDLQSPSGGDMYIEHRQNQFPQAPAGRHVATCVIITLDTRYLTDLLKGLAIAQNQTVTPRHSSFAHVMSITFPSGSETLKDRIGGFFPINLIPFFDIITQ